MPNWEQVLNEINAVAASPGPLDRVRRKYLEQLSKHTQRNVIIYYSGWLQRNNNAVQSIIYDEDMNSFMTVVNGLDTTKGLDLLLHTPGGDTAATEAIVEYLRKKFGTNIRCFVPQLAMSAGTMIACACKEIYMGKQSSIGPIDPQMGMLPVPAFALLDDFEKAKEEIKKDPTTAQIWDTIFKKVNPSFITECQQAVEFSSELVFEWLKTGMFSEQSDSEERATKITQFLNNHKDTKLHARHIDSEQAKAIGLCVKDLESDQKLQDLVLTVHHACMHSFSQVPDLYKIVENQKGIGVFTRAK